MTSSPPRATDVQIISRSPAVVGKILFADAKSHVYPAFWQCHNPHPFQPDLSGPDIVEWPEAIFKKHRY